VNKSISLSLITPSELLLGDDAEAPHYYLAEDEKRRRKNGASAVRGAVERGDARTCPATAKTISTISHHA
jgi:hypothetical protein